MQAWKRDDGRYELIGISLEEERTLFLRWRPGYRAELKNATWTCDADVLVELGAEKVFGVITGPSACGCEPMMFRWVGAREVEAVRTTRKWCTNCERYDPEVPGAAIGAYHQCDIIDVCGEPDVARAVYEAEFRAFVEG